MDKGREATLRLKRVLLGDKLQSDNRFLELISFDVADVLNNYLDFQDENLTVDMEVDGDGFYRLSVTVKAERVKNIRII